MPPKRNVDCTPATLTNSIQHHDHYLILEVRQGLGNRICSLVSGRWLANFYKRQLIVVWPIEPACPCRYTDLFEQSGPTFESIPEALSSLDLKPAETAHDHHVSDLADCLKGLDLSGLKNQVLILRIPFYCHDRADRPTRDVFSPLPANWASEPFAEEKTKAIFSAVLGQLQGPRRPELLAIEPRADIMHAVEIFQSQHFQNPIVGVHIRGTDNRFCKRNEPLFLHLIQKLLSSKEKPIIFLSSDDQKTKQKVLARGHGKVLVREIAHDSSVLRQTPMRDALIDMLLLSRVKRIYKAPFSSFSIVSAAMGNVPVTIIHSHWILRLPLAAARLISRTIGRARN